MEIWTVIGIIIGVIAIIVPIVYSNYVASRKISEQKQHVLSLININRKQSTALQSKLEQLTISKYDKNAQIFAGITFSQYINQLKVGMQESLSEEIYEMVRDEKLNEVVLSSMRSSLEQQSESLRLMLIEANSKLL